MNGRGSAILGCIMLALAGCQPIKVNEPPPVEPQLVSVNLAGKRVCGSIANNYGTFSFACDPLPIIVASGWQLTPTMLPNPRIQPPDLSVQNRGVTIVVRTPSMTRLEIAQIPNNRERWILGQAPKDLPDRNLGLVGQGRNALVEVLAEDDFTTKTWTIGLRMGLCAERVELEFVNTSSNGSVRSNPLKVFLFRDPAETICVQGGSGGVGLATTGRSGPGPMTSFIPDPACSGGAPRLFRTCEFVLGQGREIATYGETLACNFDEIRRTSGYSHSGDRTPTPKEEAGSRLIEVSGERACRGT